MIKQTTTILKTILVLLAVVFAGVGDSMAQISYNFNFDANSTGWTGNFSRFTGATACGGAGGAMRRNLYSGVTTGNLVSPLTGTSINGIVTLSYDYKVAVWSANTTGQSGNWGSFNVQYGATATGPWTTVETVNSGNHTVSGTCSTRTVTFTPPAGDVYIKFDAFYGSTGDYYLNFDNIVISEVANTACSGQPAPGATTGPSSVCANSNFNLGITNAPTGTGNTFQWESADDAAFTVNVATLGTSQNQSTSQTSAKYYRCLVTCTNSGLSDYSTPLLVSMNSFLTCYCSAVPTSVDANGAVDLVIGAWSNPNVAATPYQNFTSVTPVQLAEGTITPVTVHLQTGYSYRCWLFIDLNQDGDYTDAGEGNDLGLSSNVNPTTQSGNITIPFGAAIGITGMRLVVTDDDFNTSPCYSSSWANVEDYLIDIQSNPPCTGQPTPGNTISSVSSVCPNTNFTLSLQNNVPGQGITYLWESADDAAFTVNVATLPSTTQFATASQTSDKYYRCTVTCTLSGLSDISAPVQVTTNGYLACYCTPTHQFGSFAGDITNVTVGSINNTTTFAPSPYFTYFTTPTLPVTQGDILPVSITLGQYSRGAMWVDWDASGSFDATEYYDLGSTTTTTPLVYTTPLTVPFTSALGQVRFRVRGEYYGYTLGATDACTTLLYGETEDYIMDISAAVPCSGQPTPGNTIASASSYCLGATINYSLQNTTTGTGVTYTWERADDVNFTVNVSTLPSTLPFESVTPTGGDYYVRCQVTCTNSGLSDYSVPVLVTQNAPTACYCTPVYTVGKTDGDLISNVVITGTTLSNNTGTAPVNPAYTYFNGGGSQTGTMNAGTTYNVEVTYGSFSSQQCAVWIDFNANGVFETPSERVGFTTSNSVGSFATVSFPITLPCNPTPGTYRMRVRNVYFTNGNTIDPCASYSYGETEDYDVTVDPPPPCPAPSAFSSNTPTATGATFAWTIGCAETDWEIEYGTTGFTPGTGTVEAATTNPYTTTTMSCGTTYDVYLRANCLGGGYSTYVGPISVTTDNCPCTGTPAAASVIAPSSACSGQSFVLSLDQAYTGVSGITYQWESADDASFTTNVTLGGTAATETATQTAARYYQCYITCTNSGLTTIASYAYVTMNAPTLCYCPVTNAGSACITNVTFAAINNTTPGCSGGTNYSQQTATTTLTQGTSENFSITDDGGAITSVWIDWNQDGIFDATEHTQVTTASTPNVATTVSIAIPGTAVLGVTGMRVRTRLTGNQNGPGDACLAMGSGETEDYLVTIVPNSTVLNVTAFVQGYYLGSSSMNSVLYNQNGTSPLTDCDNVTVELHSDLDYVPEYTTTAMLSTSGTATATFAPVTAGNYYIVLKHRNSLEVWSATAQAFPATTSYNFSASGACYTDGFGDTPTTEVESGVWASWSGDIDQDGYIDVLDYNLWDPEYQAGFPHTNLDPDLDGNGYVELDDYNIWDPNYQAGNRYAQRP